MLCQLWRNSSSNDHQHLVHRLHQIWWHTEVLECTPPWISCHVTNHLVWGLYHHIWCSLYVHQYFILFYTQSDLGSVVNTFIIIFWSFTWLGMRRKCQKQFFFLFLSPLRICHAAFLFSSKRLCNVMILSHIIKLLTGLETWPDNLLTSLSIHPGHFWPVWSLARSVLALVPVYSL